MARLAVVAVAADRQDEVEVVWLDPQGSQQLAGLTEAATVAFEHAPPVREFPSFRGQRNFPGLWWSATTGEHVGYESWLERDQVMAMDADPNVVGLASQPMWLHWTAENRQPVRHAPDGGGRRPAARALPEPGSRCGRAGRMRCA
jgi:hypothetical protein